MVMHHVLASKRLFELPECSEAKEAIIKSSEAKEAVVESSEAKEAIME